VEFVNKSLKLGHVKFCALIFTNVARSVRKFVLTYTNCGWVHLKNEKSKSDDIKK